MCPNLNLLRSYKVYPRKFNFDYIKDRFYIYVYLNPFKELNKPLEVNALGKTFCFAYEPIYVGKATGSGYRQNQHLSTFRSNKENNQMKVKRLSEIQKQMAEAVARQDKSKPWNWDEYSNQYIIILETFPNAVSLLKFEVELIKNIGTVYDNTGPLTNKIKNAFSFKAARSTGNGQIL